MSVLLPTDALEAGVGAELAAGALQAAIDREEAWLARRIGQLEGERTERFPLAHLYPGAHEIRLRRPTDAASVTQAGSDISTSCEVRGLGWRLALLPEGSHYSGPLEVTYEPNDLLEVQAALIELVSLRIGTTDGGGLQADIMGSYSYTRAAGSATRIRQGIVRQLLAPAEPGSTRLHSSVRHGLAGAVGR